MKKNFINISYYLLLGIISVVFGYFGFMKLSGDPKTIEQMALLGIPKSLSVIIGFTELVLTSLLFVKYFTKMATQSLMSIMVIATCFHVLNFGFGYHLLFPVSTFILLWVSCYVSSIRRNLK